MKIIFEKARLIISVYAVVYVLFDTGGDRRKCVVMFIGEYNLHIITL